MVACDIFCLELSGFDYEFPYQLMFHGEHFVLNC